MKFKELDKKINKHFKLIIVVLLSVFLADVIIRNPNETFKFISVFFIAYISSPFIFGLIKEGETITISKNDIKSTISGFSFVLGPVCSIIIVYLAQELLSKYIQYLSFLNNFTELFTITLTLLLVYGTFCLLCFNIVLVLRPTKAKLEEKGANYEPFEKSINNLMKSGLLFLSATIFSSVGCFMLYIALVLSKANITSFLLSIYNFLVNYGLNEGYFLSSILFILLSVFVFFRGIITTFRVFKHLYYYML
ncbi:hypothetical protein [Methanobacterium ferruginis]|uniref:hypothetical protein n=1 Tax=Methanobacterium ferruginis TaxID=710191 RepID=UPI002573DEAD|nr:hypothetical protein [Methanobacterium ferruginis]MCC7551632.1 hypothetical protein [Methanobacterium sp.]